MLPDIINYVQTKNNIKKLSLIHFSFKVAIKCDFKYSKKISTKLKILSSSLESGSNRLLKLINKRFTSQEIVNFANYINKELILNIKVGFRTEKLKI